MDIEYLGNCQAKLAEQGLSNSKFVCSPDPFTTLVAGTVGIDQDEYFETHYSLFDGDAPLSIDFYPRYLDLIKGIEKHKSAFKLESFTNG